MEAGSTPHAIVPERGENLTMVFGAAAALKTTVECVVKDAYKALREAIFGRYAKMAPAVELLESDPSSDRCRRKFAKC